ncbi:PTS sugar transporter subunit IIA [Enterococcus pallens]|uniref:PTS system, mannose/fructose/sorbose family, IIA component n=1 Tax=Enterococcus pallens ATCC BAA-351 TaxID=1158607 RepID=R2SRT0_9ENTE|nr:PTS sugar transporter subunit IIA [Enterococcus pallens]EOH90829.1 PTS system, mannose/fructose/sorbose family, IIA component [Enterococcus pallens ATCC BAA-351]EOU16025.1 hypothetical protein I588_03681 [Enterococcus pallens ATCC BAA-351]OJG76320.1 PTS system, mannose/fructose/sorbose family, IIA component [Enterococcus pallens]
MKEVAVVLMSHGYYAQEALKSAEMIIGELENVATISVTPEKDLDAVVSETQKALEMVDDSNGVLLLSDILGGTPSNVAGTIVMTKENVLGITGFNLPMLLELFVNRQKNLEEIREILCQSHQNSFNVLNDILSRKEDEEDEYTIS